MSETGSHGRGNFAERFGLVTAERKEQYVEIFAKVEAEGIEVVRLSFADQHGILRGKTIMADDLAAAGYGATIGLEVEFHLFHLREEALRPEDASQPGKPPSVDLMAKGFQYLTEIRADQHEPIMQIIRREVLALGLPLRSTEVEFGPSQAEVTFHPMAPVEAADTMVQFRNAVKQICRRHGYHATFMCRPHLANIFSSGWHLHQSLSDLNSGSNSFMPEDGGVLSGIGLNYIAGILEHARAASVFTTPTLNGYKRYKAFTLAPDRAVWSSDNRGAMVRAIGGAGDTGSRV